MLNEELSGELDSAGIGAARRSLLPATLPVPGRFSRNTGPEAPPGIPFLGA